jgi:DNA-binding HxlR family transcriptional regulator
MSSPDLDAVDADDASDTDSAVDTSETDDTVDTSETTGSTDATEPVETACPIVDSIAQIGSRWRLVVLYELQHGERRFNELKRATDANARTLSRVLDDLQETGFVDRRMEADAPVATYYSLTAKGESLAPVFAEIDRWAREWLTACQRE